MGSCSNKSKEKNSPHTLSIGEIPFRNIAAENSHGTSGGAKKIKILINFNRELNQYNAITNMPKLLEIVRKKGYDLNFAYQENNPNEKYNVTVTLLFEDKSDFIAYSNFI